MDPLHVKRRGREYSRLHAHARRRIPHGQGAPRGRARRRRASDGVRRRSARVWLYGSRARGEQPGEYSDVDLIVLSTRRAKDDDMVAITLAFDAAQAEGANPFLFSVKLYDPETVAQRREIRSFFVQEVDRDKIVLAGEP